MVSEDLDLMNTVYQEISDKLGVEVALDMYQLFKGQQVTFPMRLYNAESLRKCIAQEYDGTNVKQLAAKYGYTEKTIRRMLSGK